MQHWLTFDALKQIVGLRPNTQNRVPAYEKIASHLDYD